MLVARRKVIRYLEMSAEAVAVANKDSTLAEQVQPCYLADAHLLLMIAPYRQSRPRAEAELLHAACPSRGCQPCRPSTS